MDAQRTPLTCPTHGQADLLPGEEPMPGCGSIMLSQPDNEGLIDCDDCGIWFNPATEYGSDWSERYYIVVED